MSGIKPTKATWPADIVHVNEDGWVLINRGSRQGVPVGMRLLVVGQGMRVLRDLFANEESRAEPPVVLRTRRSYELLEVVYVDETCSVAIATRAPFERRPSFYRGTDGELLVWVPLPAEYHWQVPELDDDDLASINAANDAQTNDGDESATDSERTDEPPERGEQDDDLWEQALPLNSVSVGDIVVPAIPAQLSPSTAAQASDAIPSIAPSVTTPDAGEQALSPTATVPGASPYEEGRTYDWMKPGE